MHFDDKFAVARRHKIQRTAATLDEQVSSIGISNDDSCIELRINAARRAINDDSLTLLCSEREMVEVTFVDPPVDDESV